jgi:DNA-binding transcriptional LysR family regulator
MDKFNNMQIFCRIVELGTFAAVAREKQLSAMMISKYMAQLEKSLGVSLLNRTTRQLSLTEAGEDYYLRCKQLLEDLSELEEHTTQLGRHVKGTLKISTPIDFGGIYMAAAIDAYHQQYPEVAISMVLDNGSVHLSSGKVDVAIRVTDCVEPGIIARRINDTTLCNYASPIYLQRYGAPRSIDELSTHRCLHYSNTPHRDNWIFNVDGELRKIKLPWHFACNNGRVLCQAAALGMGIVQAPAFAAQSYVDNGKLVEILDTYCVPNISVYATYLQRRFLPAKLTTFVDFLVDYFKDHEAFSQTRKPTDQIPTLTARR